MCSGCLPPALQDPSSALLMAQEADCTVPSTGPIALWLLVGSTSGGLLQQGTPTGEQRQGKRGGICRLLVVRLLPWLCHKRPCYCTGTFTEKRVLQPGASGKGSREQGES